MTLSSHSLRRRKLEILARTGHAALRRANFGATNLMAGPSPFLTFVAASWSLRTTNTKGGLRTFAAPWTNGSNARDAGDISTALDGDRLQS